jgi:hypothetical protein
MREPIQYTYIYMSGLVAFKWNQPRYKNNPHKDNLCILLPSERADRTGPDQQNPEVPTRNNKPIDSLRTFRAADLLRASVIV